MSKQLLKKLVATMSGAGFLLLMSQQAQAFTIGVAALDALIVQWETGIPGAGLAVCAIGLIGLALSRMENQYGQWFQGIFPYCVTAGFLGGGVALLGTLGVLGGALLPV